MTSPSADLKPQTYQARRREILTRASKTGADAILVFGYGSALGAGSKSHGAMRYLTGWDSHEAMSLLVMNPRDTFLIISSPFMVPVARETRQDIEIIDRRPTEWAAFLKDQSRSLGNAGTIGFDEMPFSLHRMLTPLLDDLQPQSIDRQLGEMQLIKYEEALQFHGAGAEICDRLPRITRRCGNRSRRCWRPVWLR